MAGVDIMAGGASVWEVFAFAARMKFTIRNSRYYAASLLSTIHLTHYMAPAAIHEAPTEESCVSSRRLSSGALGGWNGWAAQALAADVTLVTL